VFIQSINEFKSFLLRALGLVVVVAEEDDTLLPPVFETANAE
jgi:hypothetical protein